MSEKKGFVDKISDFIMDHVAGPVTKFSDLKLMVIVRDGLVGVMPVILIGSIFLLLFVVATPSIGASGKPLIPFLSPYAFNFILVYQLTMNIMALYAAVSFSFVFARVYKLNELNLSILGLGSFLLIMLNVVDGTGLNISNFGGGGLFVAMISSIGSGYIYKLCIDKNLVIKMPEGVPPGIGAAFSALIPFAISFTVFWIVRSILGIDVSVIISNLIAPMFKAADNIFVYTIRVFISLSFWAIGIHGDALLNPVLSPAYITWVTGNAAAATSGVPLNQLPYIWTMAFERTTVYTASMWGLMFWQLLSRRKNHRTLAIASIPSAACCIIEPIVFGTPIVLNGMLMIPWILSGTISSFLGYLWMSLGISNRFFIDLPWATPSPILAVVSSGGDWKNLMLIVIALVTGIVVYMPFFKALEKQEEAKELARSNTK